MKLLCFTRIPNSYICNTDTPNRSGGKTNLSETYPQECFMFLINICMCRIWSHIHSIHSYAYSTCREYAFVLLHSDHPCGHRSSIPSVRTYSLILVLVVLVSYTIRKYILIWSWVESAEHYWIFLFLNLLEWEMLLMMMMSSIMCNIQHGFSWKITHIVQDMCKEGYDVNGCRSY